MARQISRPPSTKLASASSTARRAIASSQSVVAGRSRRFPAPGLTSRPSFIEHRIGRDLRNLERFTTNPALVTIGFMCVCAGLAVTENQRLTDTHALPELATRTSFPTFTRSLRSQ